MACLADDLVDRCLLNMKRDPHAGERVPQGDRRCRPLLPRCETWDQVERSRWAGVLSVRCSNSDQSPVNPLTI
jgi:hypothetical protein